MIPAMIIPAMMVQGAVAVPVVLAMMQRRALIIIPAGDDHDRSRNVANRGGLPDDDHWRGADRGPFHIHGGRTADDNTFRARKREVDSNIHVHGCLGRGHGSD
jgi:hypothetical protein